MALTGADRQRRSRAHKRGDHSLCDPAKCAPDGPVTKAVTPVTRDALSDLGAPGRRLWRELDGESASGATWTLTLEACRITDRLAKLDRLLTGEAADWLRLVEQAGNGDALEVVIDKPLSEARQQAIALKQVLSELRQMSAAAAKPPARREPDQPMRRVSGVADLTARIAARQQAAG